MVLGCMHGCGANPGRVYRPPPRTHTRTHARSVLHQRTYSSVNEGRLRLGTGGEMLKIKGIKGIRATRVCATRGGGVWRVARAYGACVCVCWGRKRMGRRAKGERGRDVSLCTGFSMRRLLAMRTYSAPSPSAPKAYAATPDPTLRFP